MVKLNSRFMTVAALSAMLLAGCGGSSSSVVDAGGGGVTPPPANQTITDVFGYISQLIATADANSDPIDINGLTLATDDTAEPSVVN